jgi:glucosyl-dolichyl phosphate glucuronosyltransferase
VNISVIISTYNRYERLAGALKSLAASRLPEPIDWEVLVVDNNSTDQTRQVVDGIRAEHPQRFRYLLEPQAGKSRALNKGIEAAQGDILVFIDDDVVVEPSWLDNLTVSLRSGACAGVAGRILPEGGFRPPPWLSVDGRFALAPLALFDLGPQAGELHGSPFGANMAYRKEMFRKHGGFRIDLGPAAGTKEPQKSEDSEFGMRLLAAGERLRYEPSAIVYHEIPAGRVRKDYFLKWWFDKNRSDILAFGIPTDTRWFFAGIPLYLLRRTAAWTVRWLLAVEASRRFSCKIKVWALAGSVLECFRQSRLKKKHRAHGRAN